MPETEPQQSPLSAGIKAITPYAVMLALCCLGLAGYVIYATGPDKAVDSVKVALACLAAAAAMISLPHISSLKISDIEIKMAEKLKDVEQKVQQADAKAELARDLADPNTVKPDPEKLTLSREVKKAALAATAAALRSSGPSVAKPRAMIDTLGAVEANVKVDTSIDAAPAIFTPGKPGPADDPQKGRFGGKSVAEGYGLEATVKPTPDDEDWFQIELTVKSVDDREPLSGPVKFYLHPTFRVDERTVVARNGNASLSVFAYGAFTVGAVVNDRVPLELDLAELADAPQEFRER